MSIISMEHMRMLFQIKKMIMKMKSIQYIIQIKLSKRQNNIELRKKIMTSDVPEATRTTRDSTVLTFDLPSL